MTKQKPDLSRRTVLAALAGSTAAVGGAVAVAANPSAAAQADAAAGVSTTYPFYGEHQAGITTPAQDRLHFAAFDVTGSDRASLIRLLKRWTTMAADLTQGLPAGAGDAVSYNAPPLDSGETQGLPASALSITIGFGPSLFHDASGTERFGIGGRRPAALERLPHFPGDTLDPQRSDGDLCIQACADDPQVAVHAIRNLSRAAFGIASLRWAQLGYGRTSSTTSSQATPRNLFGFKDGTANILADQHDALREHVWVSPDDDPRAAWLAGGSYLVARRISMTIETWDRSSLREQEQVFGRDRGEGAPLSGGTEFTAPNFTALGGDGKPLIAKESHVHLAHPDNNNGVRILRRGYNFTDGSDSLGRLDAGLFFLAFMRDPGKQFTPMQNRMAKSDLLREYIRHTGSAVFAVPPGAREGEYIGQSLFA